MARTGHCSIFWLLHQLKSTNALAHVKNVELLAQLLEDVVEEVGAENVI